MKFIFVLNILLALFPRSYAVRLTNCDESPLILGLIEKLDTAGGLSPDLGSYDLWNTWNLHNLFANKFKLFFQAKQKPRVSFVLHHCIDSPGPLEFRIKSFPFSLCI